MENQFVRITEGVYSFGSKKVSVTIKNGSLVCRVGGGYMMIDQFLEFVFKQDSEKTSPISSPFATHRRPQTLSEFPDYTKED